MKEIIESLSNPNILKSDFDFSVEIVNKKVKEVWSYICDESDRYFEDYNFQYNPKTDSDFIKMKSDYPFVSEISIPNPSGKDYIESTYVNPFYLYNEGFPTELLWTDNWQLIVKEHIADSLVKLTEKRCAVYEKNRIKRHEKRVRQKDAEIKQKLMVEVIKTKLQSALTAEEYEFILTKIGK